ncbi:ncs2p [Saccharomyces arboricola H-6]|uniref:Cytoplasmic tRNA 2-thiolation protein 2 n=1 Tax=Saccharomyces arboricola (strain H-6 / AS 2.3317 / CBS 10644) TaxID=1160507 RepID=J8Q025_SACAR|nr:ncs2p [Saccharomyces arboricola H-6]
MECQRCHVSGRKPATVNSRKERFCDECFINFVSIKQRKQMMKDEFFRNLFKVVYPLDQKESIGKILLPLSPSDSGSLVMLDIVHDLLLEQLKQHNNHTGFTVDVLTIFTEENFPVVRERMESLVKEKMLELNKTSNIYKVHFININEFFNSTSEVSSLIIDDGNFEIFTKSRSVGGGNRLTLDEISGEYCLNNSSRTDLTSIMKVQLIKHFAYENGNNAIMWGHSMTKLSEVIISLVVKGKGSQIATFLDTESFDNLDDKPCNYKNLYPMKDLLSVEIESFLQIKNLAKYLINAEETNSKPSCSVTKNPSPSLDKQKLVKNMTINEITNKYFQDIQNDYSNIISTVLRTADKLTEPISNMIKPSKCQICQSKIYSNPSDWLDRITVTSPYPIETNEEEYLFKQWQDSKLGQSHTHYMQLLGEIKNDNDGSNKDDKLCYGCLILLNTSIKDKNLIWPKVNTMNGLVNSTNNDRELSQILEQFEINSDLEE